MRMFLLVLFLAVVGGNASAQSDASVPDAQVVMDAAVVNVVPDLTAQVAIPLPPPGAIPEASPQEVLSLVRLFTNAVKHKDYALAAAFALMVLAWGLRKMFPRLPPQFIPLVTLLLSSVPTIVVVLKSPTVTWDEALTTLFVVWFMSAGQWENAVKAARDGVPVVLAWLSKLAPKKEAPAPVDVTAVVPAPAPLPVPEDKTPKA
jgi:hypothetical protein